MMKETVILLFALMFVLINCSCAQLRDVARMVDSTVIAKFELWKEIEGINLDRLNMKRMKYESINIENHIDRIFRTFSIDSNQIDVFWYYNPLEYQSYVFILYELSDNTRIVYRYYLSEPYLQPIGIMRDRSFDSVVEFLCNKPSQKLESSFFVFISFLPDGDISANIPKGFSFTIDLQLSIMALNNALER